MRYVFADCELDTQLCVVRSGDTQRPLRPKPLQVLLHLLEHRNRVVPKQELAERLWPDQYISDTVIENNILAARRAVGDSGRAQRIIRTLHGHGYRFIAPVTLIDETEEAFQLEALTSSVEERPPVPMLEGNDAARVRNATASPAIEAARRQLTVLFCDLVGSTELSSQVDPEDYADIIGAYHTACAAVIERYEGHIAQYLGDGLLVYFGYPQAHEDDAQRAVHTALAILERLRQLNDQLQVAHGIQVAVRLGIHTGAVVMSAVGSGGHAEPLAMGETPNIAARIQALATANTIVLSAATYRLAHGYFACRALGSQALAGLAEPIELYQVLHTSNMPSRFSVAITRGLTPLVGRAREQDLLLDRWAQARNGNGQVVLISGEVGIGKSRLVQVLKDHLIDRPHTQLECQSSPYHQNTALYPVIDLFQRLLTWHQMDTLEQRLKKLKQELSQYRLPLDETVPLFATLLSLFLKEECSPPLNLTPQAQRQKTLEMIVAILLERAERQPLLFVLEDLHWTDPTTVELLGLLMDQVPTAAILLLLTCRPEFEPPWGLRSHLTSMALQRFTRPQIDLIVEHITSGKSMPATVRQHLVEKSDGIPLYVEEMTKTILESGMLTEADTHDKSTESLMSFAIPMTLQDSLMARLDRLNTGKSVAQLGAMIGREFSYELLQMISPLDEATLRRELGKLVERELLYQRGVLPHATYIFKHALIQDAAYQSLLKGIRQQYHQRIAQALEERFPEIVETQPELMAHHYAEAACPDQAIVYWQRAGQHAAQRSAHQEAERHLRTGLQLLVTRPETPERTEQELDLHMALGPVLMATRGNAATEVEQTYSRARALCQQLEETPQLFPTLRGLWRFYNTGGRLAMAQEVGEQLLSLAQRQHDATRRMVAHTSLGHTLALSGAFTAARTHLDQGIALSDPEAQRTLILSYGQAPGVQCLFFAAMSLWCLGYSEQSLARCQMACALAQELGHPLSLAGALYWAANLHLLRREAHAGREQAETLIALSTEHTLPQFLAQGRCLLGWALAVQGQGEEGVKLMRQGVMDMRATGTYVAPPSFLPALAEAYSALGQVDEALLTVAEALELSEQTGMHWREAETYRIKGIMLLRQADPDACQAESCFQQALGIARDQQAKPWELRAAMSLARLWQSQDKREAAYGLLAPVYEWFTEGFDTADLMDARLLLDELRV